MVAKVKVVGVDISSATKRFEAARYQWSYSGKVRIKIPAIGASPEALLVFSFDKEESIESGIRQCLGSLSAYLQDLQKSVTEELVLYESQ
jgi:hypothetical protein